MSRDRGLRLQNALAAYLRQWWPSAESAGAGRKGTDVLGTPGIVWENKTSGKGDRNIGAWIEQARSHVRVSALATMPAQPDALALVPDVPVVAYWPPGVGEGRPESVIAMLPLGVLVRLLREAGYGDQT